MVTGMGIRPASSGCRCVRVSPRYTSTVTTRARSDEFDGSFQSLRLEEGEYHIEIMASGYDTIAFDVRIQPGRKINYRGELFAELQP